MTDSDERLVQLAREGDTGALGALLERHLHPAWRIASATSSTVSAAEESVVTGFCDAVNAAGRHPDITISLRTRIAAAVHRAGVAADRARRGRDDVSPGDDPVIAAFRALPVASRTALWLTDVEGGTPEQVAPVLGLDRRATEALADRAAVALRDSLATEAARRATDPDCRTALGKLPAHAAGKLTTDERRRVGEHLAACGDCASWLAAMVAPRPALRRLVAPVPESLPTAVADAWAERGGRDRSPLLRPWSERAIGAAAAVVLAVGLGGALVLSGRDDDDPELAAPAGTLDLSDDGDADLPDPVLPAPTGVLSSGSEAGTGDGAPEVAKPAPDRSPTPDEVPEPTAPPTTTPPAQTPPSAEPPAAEDSPTIDLGVVSVDLDESPEVEVEIPGLPPISVPPDSASATAGSPVEDSAVADSPVADLGTAVTLESLGALLP